MLQLAIFISGTGSNFRAIHSAILDGRLDAVVRLLVSSKSDSPAIPYARQHGIQTWTESTAQRAAADYPETLLTEMRRNEVDFIALCGYLKLVPSPVVNAFRNRMLNIHPALLPSFGGHGMYGHHVHQAVLDSGAKFSGATVHLVTEEYDRGPIILQDVVPVLDEDSPESLAKRVLEVEHSIYPKALQLFADNRIHINGLRTYFQP